MSETKIHFPSILQLYNFGLFHLIKTQITYNNDVNTFAKHRIYLLSLAAEEHLHIILRQPEQNLSEDGSFPMKRCSSL